MTPARQDRFSLRTSPLQLLRTKEPWTATGCLAGYVLLGPVLFGFTALVVTVCFVLNITWLGLPLMIGAAAFVRGCAHVERTRVGLFSAPVTAEYREVAEPGLLAGVRTRWTDPAVLRDLAYLTVLFIPLLLLDAVALVLWLTTLALILVPAWYWAVPDGGAVGLLAIDDLPAAFAAAAVACVLSLVSVYAVTGAARLHCAVAHAVLGPRSDPLAEAKRVLAEPGPLTPPSPSESLVQVNQGE